MILDEFVRFGKLPFLLEMPALCRSYNVVPLFITQDYAMIRKYYSDDDLKIVKHPNAKAIGLPRLMLPIGRVWFSLCVPNHRDFTEFDLQRIPYRSHTSYLQRRNFAYFLR